MIWFCPLIEEEDILKYSFFNKKSIRLKKFIYTDAKSGGAIGGRKDQ